MKKAYLLFSGGLDSIIAAKLLRNAGFSVIGVHFKTPFFGKSEKELKKVAETLNIDLEIIDITEEFFPVLKNPPHGYGKNVNPCIDCKVLMLRKLKEIAGDGIIATGEVLGQRPMSQRGDSLKRIERIAGLKGRVFRPLSARLLPETVYEKEGIIKREYFLDIKGRSRKRYPEIIEKIGLNMENLPTPAGGCLLTEPSFAGKVKDLITHDQLTVKDAELLKIGRHFRIGKGKLVVGRNREENPRLKEIFEDGEILLYTESVPGPTGLLRWDSSDSTVEQAAMIVARYSDGKDSDKVSVIVKQNGKEKKMEVSPGIDVAPFRVN
ncbi:DUF814 domain-containing protein [Desulfurobacterium atlanticum]|uniref:NFACT protein RNA binding domain-containing protein n=1 Tax=Desulfurobacterium atlanticum TaxID=240169 RepID=A0A238YZE1_9BACT|nr:DUF814 domain-containing protein [Desulfurobacterium atlanticum]SNR76078.1 protein of unknown function [Desulfurobacterium atlanticum]